MKELKCAYHPHLNASEKCERCNRLICLQDKVTHNVNTGMDSYHSYSKIILCPLCNVDTVGEGKDFAKKGNMGMIVFMIFIMILMITFMLSFGFLDAFGSGIILVPIGFFVIAFLMLGGFNAFTNKQINRVENEAVQTKERFLQSIKDPSIRQQYEDSPLRCIECGSDLSLEDIYCPSCGDSTEEERSYVSK